jgi:hypothetical protein
LFAVKCKLPLYRASKSLRAILPGSHQRPTSVDRLIFDELNSLLKN